MARDIKRMRQGFSVNRQLGEALDKLSEDTRINKSTLADEALEYLLQAHGVVIENYEFKFKFSHTK